MITNKDISEKLVSYLQHQVTLKELVYWCEDALLHNNFEDDPSHKIRNILAKIGSSDVKNFGLTWEDFEEIMHKLGYSLQVLARDEN
ncbi:MAG: hypothetical protein ABI359_15680 [Ginsengibacter sp.]